MTEHERTMAMIARCIAGQNGLAGPAAIQRALDLQCQCPDCRQALLTALAANIWLAG